jgi:beta-xylosidase
VGACSKQAPVKVLFPGNWADPTIVKVGEDYYLTSNNDRQDASSYYAGADGKWIKLEQSDDISGFQHNIFGGFLSVHPGIFVTGEGKASFSYFKYRSLE